MKRAGTSSECNSGNLVSTQLSGANLRACGNQVSTVRLVSMVAAQIIRLASAQNRRRASIPELCLAQKLEEFCGNQVSILGSAVVEEIEGRRSANRPSAGAALTRPAGSRQRAASAGCGNQVATCVLEAERNATITRLTSNRLRGDTSNPQASVRSNCTGGGCGNQVSTRRPTLDETEKLRLPAPRRSAGWALSPPTFTLHQGADVARGNQVSTSDSTAPKRGQGRGPCPSQATKGRAPVLASWNSGNLVSSGGPQVGASLRVFHTDQMSAFCRLWTPHYGIERVPVLRAAVGCGHSESVSRLYKEA